MNSIVKGQKEQVRTILDSASSVGIVIGRNQNIDTVAAGLALYLAFKAEGKNAQVISQSQPTVEVSSLVGVDKIKNSFDGDTRILTISVPNNNDEIEKVSYNIEGDRLKVNLFAEERGISFSENDIEYIKKGSSPSVIVTIGVQNEDELNSIVDPASVKTIHIDRNPSNSLMGDVSLIDPSFSSISEIVTELFIELSMADIDAFQNLMDGITYATRNFTNPATSAFAFEAAGFLLQSGAKRKEQRDNKPRRDNFPQESHFLNDNRGQNRGNNRQNQNQNQNKNRQNQTPQRNMQNIMNELKTASSPVVEPSFEDITSDSEELPKDFEDNFPSQAQKYDDTEDLAPKPIDNSDDSVSSDIPEDWFLPKVFKGSKKTNN